VTVSRFFVLDGDSLQYFPCEDNYTSRNLPIAAISLVDVIEVQCQDPVISIYICIKPSTKCSCLKLYASKREEFDKWEDTWQSLLADSRLESVLGPTPDRSGQGIYSSSTTTMMSSELVQERSPSEYEFETRPIGSVFTGSQMLGISRNRFQDILGTETPDGIKWHAWVLDGSSLECHSSNDASNVDKPTFQMDIKGQRIKATGSSFVLQTTLGKMTLRAQHKAGYEIWKLGLAREAIMGEDDALDEANLGVIAEDAAEDTSGQELAAINIQKRLRGNAARQEASKIKEEKSRKEGAAATKIQSQFRGNATRQEFERQKKQREAEEKSRKEAVAAATKIQSQFRGNNARDEIAKTKEAARRKEAMEAKAKAAADAKVKEAEEIAVKKQRRHP
jgi:colicin import membrane protein